VQGSDALFLSAHIEHDLAVPRCHCPLCPWAAFILYGDELAQFVVDARFGKESYPQAIGGFNALVQGCGGEPVPAACLRRQAFGCQRAGDRAVGRIRCHA
jgi:hypothetical protein